MTDTTPALDPALDPELAGLLAFLAQSGQPPMWEQTPEDARKGFRVLTVDLLDPALVPQLEEVRDTTIPGGAGELRARVYRPAAGPLPTIVFFHGGGWVIGDLDTHDLTCRTLARDADAVVVSVDYRLAPEHPFPAAIEDALAATRWVADHEAELGGAGIVAVGGDSAGGNLSAVVAQVFRDEGRDLAGQLLIYPATDISGDYPSLTENGEGYFLDTGTMGWFLEQYAAGADPADPRLSPLLGDVTGVAPAVVVVAQFDPLRDSGTAYARKLEAAGVPVELRTFGGLIHGFVDMGRHSRGAQAAVDETFRLFRSVLHD